METTDNMHETLKENQSVFFRALGTTHKVLSKSVDGSAAVLEHTLEPKSLGAPLHKHTHEDEISCVLEGQLSVMQNGVVKTAGPGEYIAKPRNVFHTFWNAGDQRARFIEIIVPGNFEHYFAELAKFFPAGKPPEFENIAATAKKYGLIIDPSASEGIIREYGLKPL